MNIRARVYRVRVYRVFFQKIKTRYPRVFRVFSFFSRFQYSTSTQAIFNLTTRVRVYRVLTNLIDIRRHLSSLSSTRQVY